MNSILEITENEYLIKLNRNTFNLSLVSSLLKIVEVLGPGDKDEPQKTKPKTTKPTSEDELDDDDNHDVGMPDRRISPSQNHNAEPDYFDPLDEK